MDSRRTKVGVLTNYNVFLVILRTGKDKIVLSSPVIRDRISRASLEPGLANDVSVWKLLLALLLYVGRPENLQGKTGIWADLWVRDPGERKEISTKKRKRNSGRDGGDQRKTTKAGEEDRSGSPAEPDDKDGAEELDHKVHCGSTSSSNSRAGSNAEIKPTDASSMDLTFTDYPSMDDEPSSLPRLSPSPSSYLDARSPLYRANLHFHQTSRQISPQDLLWFEERRFQLTKPSPSLSNIEADPWLSLDEMIAEGPHFTTFSASALGRLNPHTDNLSDSCHTEPDTFAAGSSPKTLVDLVLSPPQCQYILKLARLFSPPHHTELGIVSGSDIVSALELEVRCLTDHLVDLQGSIVPRFHGLWLSQSPGGQWAILLLEKVGLGGKQIRRWEDLTWSESSVLHGECGFPNHSTRYLQPTSSLLLRFME